MPIEDEALKQLRNVASLPFVFRWVAAMPDIHWGIGATVGSVIPTHEAINCHPNHVPKEPHCCVGRGMSRAAARKRFSVKDHERATRGVERRKDPGVIDETPAAYRPIDAVMEAQADLVEAMHALEQVVCVKG